MDCKGKIGTQGLYYLLKSIGYENVSINTRETEPNIFRLNASHGKCGKNPILIKKILKFPDVNFSEYVYDLETTEGIFHSGIGEMIVKNTDSNYVNFPHLKKASDCWEHSVKVATEVSRIFPKPMSLAFEEKIYAKFMILTKKRYMSLACKKDGILDTKISKKGVLLNRRDNCEFVRKVYSNVVMDIFNQKDIEHIVEYILEELNKLCGKVYDAENFLITKSIGEIGELKPYVSTDKNNKTCYKIGDYKVKILPSDEKAREKQFKLKNCETEEEYYLRCLPAQAQLSEKMRNRGQLVAAGSRIGYVITTNGGHTAKQYEKVEHYDYFCKHSRILSIDYLYYLKQLSNPLDQILDIIYTGKLDKNGKVWKKEFMFEQYKIRLQKAKLIAEIENLNKPKIIFI